MYIERIFTDGLAQVAYLVADEDAREAAIIDPRRDVDVYLDRAQNLGCRIVAILDTHVHADFVSGARELAERSDATIYAPGLGEQEYPHVPLGDRQEVRVGRLVLRALWTPGHTPEHLAYLLFDSAGGSEPQALFSGDMLFVGEVGRPDLLGEANTRRLALQLYDSVFERLSLLPDGLIVYPGHGAGSSCGRSIGSAPTTTIGQERRFNYAFQPRTPEEFVHVILDRMPLPPTYYPILKHVNRVGPPLLRDLQHGHPLTPTEVNRLSTTGAVLIDARAPEAFAGGHVPGSVSIGFGGDFTAWCGWLAPHDRDVVLILERDDEFIDARRMLRLIGVDRVVGYLQGGIGAWERAGYDIAALPSISVHELGALLSSQDDVHVLDVRSDVEWDGGHVDGAIHQFAGEIMQGADGLPADGVLAVMCAGGYRSCVTSSVLAQRGARNVVNVLGGLDAWQAAGYPTVRE